ncbi:tumor necrosis factor alpha-induced protein 3 isoform X2 [Nematostella vectensis]|uniref:tumor necrosis factor alpha-induced protein 3 isoform X2 n=1 Tax=Nematostella vectensis TaxID=45351 RepID=UPI0020774739|nr:tumor necrosis factor alpha-induced protein 3 isoform X2 [Nematostella vectensis]
MAFKSTLERSISLNHLDLALHVRETTQEDLVIPKENDDIKHRFFQSLNKSTFFLPSLNKYDEGFQKFLFSYLLDVPIFRELQAERKLNWCSALHTVVPVLTLGDGNCLMHAASIGMWAVSDRYQVLRKAVYDVMIEDHEGIFHMRWQFETEKQHSHLGYKITEEQWTQEWREVLRLVSTDHTPRGTNALSCDSLEEIHIFILANILRRSIIVVSEDVLRGNYDESLSPVNLGGIYLPLNWDPVECVKTPLLIGYAQGHFTALVSIEDGNAGAGDTHKIHGVPLVKPDGSALPVHFLLSDEEHLADGFIRQYMDCGKVAHEDETNQRRMNTLIAKLHLTPPLESVKHLVDTYFESAKQAYNRMLADMKNKTQDSSLTPVKCCTQGCTFYATAETAFLCSKCLNEYLRKEGMANKGGGYEVPQVQGSQKVVMGNEGEGGVNQANESSGIVRHAGQEGEGAHGAWGLENRPREQKSPIGIEGRAGEQGSCQQGVQLSSMELLIETLPQLWLQGQQEQYNEYQILRQKQGHGRTGRDVYYPERQQGLYQVYQPANMIEQQQTGAERKTQTYPNQPTQQQFHHSQVYSQAQQHQLVSQQQQMLSPAQQSPTHAPAGPQHASVGTSMGQSQPTHAPAGPQQASVGTSMGQSQPAQCATVGCKYQAQPGKGKWCLRCFDSQKEEFLPSAPASISQPEKCRNNDCTFFGLPSQDGLCSSCYRRFCIYMETTYGGGGNTSPIPLSAPTYGPTPPPLPPRVHPRVEPTRIFGGETSGCQMPGCRMPGVADLYGRCVECYHQCIKTFINTNEQIASPAVSSPQTQPARPADTVSPPTVPPRSTSQHINHPLDAFGRPASTQHTGQGEPRMMGGFAGLMSPVIESQPQSTGTQSHMSEVMSKIYTPTQNPLSPPLLGPYAFPSQAGTPRTAPVSNAMQAQGGSGNLKLYIPPHSASTERPLPIPVGITQGGEGQTRCTTRGCQFFGNKEMNFLCSSCYARTLEEFSLLVTNQNTPVATTLVTSEPVTTKCVIDGCMNGASPNKYNGLCSNCYHRGLDNEAEWNAIRQKNTQLPHYQSPPFSQPGAPYNTTKPSYTQPGTTYNTTSTSYTQPGAPCQTKGCLKFGTPAKKGLCEKCFNKYQQKQAQKETQGPFSSRPQGAGHDPRAWGTTTTYSAQAPVHISRQREPGPGMETGLQSKCVRPGCQMYGAPETNGYCSKCLMDNMRSVYPESVPDNGRLSASENGVPANVTNSNAKNVAYCFNASCQNLANPRLQGHCTQCFEQRYPDLAGSPENLMSLIAKHSVKE